MTTSTATAQKLMRLDPAFRQSWLDALRSSEWEGKETYVDLQNYSGDKFCALGLALKINNVPSYGHTEEDDPPISYSWLKQQGVPVSHVWMEFDGNRMTFAQFADWLEANSEPAS